MSRPDDAAEAGDIEDPVRGAHARSIADSECADAEGAARPQAWGLLDMSGAYRQLEHPADIFLEIEGRDLGQLLGNALYAFYSQIAEVERVEPRELVVIEVAPIRVDEMVRAVLAEALYRFDTEGFVGAAVTVRVCEEDGADAGPTRPRTPDGDQGLRVRAEIWGERLHRPTDLLLTEVKAVTYHRLQARRRPEGVWRATVILDV
jgi:SHS2 domain-containing protein